jgi:hypothetical protein
MHRTIALAAKADIPKDGEAVEAPAVMMRG